MKINYYIKDLKYTAILTLGYHNYIEILFLKSLWKADLTDKKTLEKEDFENILIREFIDKIKNKKEIKDFRISRNIVVLEAIFDSKYLKIDYSKDDRLELSLYSGKFYSYFDSYYKYRELSPKYYLEILDKWI